MRNFAAKVEYDGTAYFGFCKQPEQPTIQGQLEEVLSRIFEKEIKVIGSGRTDRGVHALGQVVNFLVPAWDDLPSLKQAINANLPFDIRVVALKEVADDFHARYSAQRREYVYTICLAQSVPFYLERFVYQWNQQLDAEKMQQAARVFLGEHDFSSFCTAEEEQNRTRRLFSFDVFSEEVDDYLGEGVKGRKIKLLRFRLCANAFLRKMVRTLVGALVEVGRGKREIEELEQILAAKDRCQAGVTLPANGLCLTKVFYAEGDWQ